MRMKLVYSPESNEREWLVSIVAETGCRWTMRRWFTIIVVTCARNKPQSPPPRCTCVPPPPSRNGCILTGSARARAIDIFTLPRQERAPAIWPTDPQAAAGRRERGHEAPRTENRTVRGGLDGIECDVKCTRWLPMIALIAISIFAFPDKSAFE